MKNNSDKIIYDDTYTVSVEHVTRGKTRYKDLKEFLINLLNKHGPLSRNQMVDLTGIPRTTLFDALDKLILEERVEKYKLKLNKKGRPVVYYEIKK